MAYDLTVLIKISINIKKLALIQQPLLEWKNKLDAF